MPEAELRAVTHGREPLDGGMEWFRTRFRTLNLQPTILLDYERRAFVSDGEARITFDRAITAARVDAGSCSFGALDDARPVGDRVIVEVKGPATSAPVQAAMGALERTVCEFSKYSLGLEAVGLETEVPDGGPGE